MLKQLQAHSFGIVLTILNSILIAGELPEIGDWRQKIPIPQPGTGSAQWRSQNAEK